MSGSILFRLMEYLAAFFVFMVGVVLLIVVVFYVIDVSQTENAIRRNYPVIGRLRTVFERLGEFFRQYFFAMDREELPFNRAERNWVERATTKKGNTVAFGSTRNLRPIGSVMFVNCPFPTLDEDAVETKPVVIGPNCRQPYETRSLFNVSAMSYGSLSAPAVRALSRGAAVAGAWLNTGEGGLSPYHLEGGCDVIFQMGTAKFGVRTADGGLDDDKLRTLAEKDAVKMIEIKLSQGAKPGKGGILPGIKVDEEISKIRGIPIGVAAISPNRHPEVNNIAQLLDMIAHVREVSGLPVGYKAVIGAFGWLDKLAEEINRRGIDSAPDFITVDGADGGTGAAPMPLIDDMGLPLREGLPLLIDVLARHGLRDRVKVIASGKLITPAEVAWALCMGADFIASARGNMFALGCIQAMQCNKNTCPTGITTHDPRLQKGLVVHDKAEAVANYIRNLVKEVGIISHSCGVNEPRELKRHHARMVVESGRSVPLDELFPYAEPLAYVDSARVADAVAE